MEEHKYAIVRLKKSQMVEFFSVIAAHGFTDVSFVTDISQAMEGRKSEAFTKEIKEEKIESEDQADTSTTSPSDDRFHTQLNNHLAMMVNVNKNSGSPTLNGNDLGAQVENGPSPAPSLRDLEVGGGRLVKEEIDESQEHDDIAAAASSDLLSNLFATHQIPFGNTPPSSHGVHHTRNSPFKQQQPLQFQTRMKGWQREYIKDVINNGHYPTEEELRDIEQKCDLSRKQVLRFIAKRLVNPNRKPRADWRSDKAADAALNDTVPLVKEEA